MKRLLYIILFAGFTVLSSNVLAQEVVEKPKAYFSISDSYFQLGSIKEGGSKSVNVAFTNTGKKPLIISNVYTNCGCTEIEYPREPFMPGKSGSLKITYNATEGEGVFSKTVTVYTNAKNNKETIKIEGVVTPK